MSFLTCWPSTALSFFHFYYYFFKADQSGSQSFWSGFSLFLLRLRQNSLLVHGTVPEKTRVPIFACCQPLGLISPFSSQRAPLFNFSYLLSHSPTPPCSASPRCSPRLPGPSVALSILDIGSAIRISTNTNILIYMERTEGDILSVTIGYNYHVSHLYSILQLLELFSHALSHLILLTMPRRRQLFIPSFPHRIFIEGLGKPRWLTQARFCPDVAYILDEKDTTFSILRLT